LDEKGLLGHLGYPNTLLENDTMGNDPDPATART